MRQITEAFGIKPQFEVGVVPKGLSLYTMTEYKKEFPFPILFPKEVPSNTLAEWLAKKDLPQFHCAGRWGSNLVKCGGLILCIYCRD